MERRGQGASSLLHSAPPALAQLSTWTQQLASVLSLRNGLRYPRGHSPMSPSAPPWARGRQVGCSGAQDPAGRLWGRLTPASLYRRGFGASERTPLAPCPLPLAPGQAARVPAGAGAGCPRAWVALHSPSAEVSSSRRAAREAAGAASSPGQLLSKGGPVSFLGRWSAAGGPWVLEP